MEKRFRIREMELGATTIELEPFKDGKTKRRERRAKRNKRKN